MKILQRKNKSVLLVIGAVILAVLLATSVSYATTGSFFGWKISENAEVKTDGDNPPSKEQIENGNRIKEEALKDGSTSGSDQPQQPITQEDGKKLVELNIVSINPIESFVRVSTMISALDNSGTCTLTVKNSAGATVYTSSVQTQSQSNTSTCKGFDVPKSNLPSGNYVFNVSYAGGLNYGTVEQSYASE